MFLIHPLEIKHELMLHSCGITTEDDLSRDLVNLVNLVIVGDTHFIGKLHQLLCHDTNILKHAVHMRATNPHHS
jgi:hypothetical protein